MDGIFSFFNRFYDSIAGLSADLVLLIALCSYGGIFLCVFVGCFISDKLRSAGKRPFFHFTNAFTAVVFAVFSLKFKPAPSALFTSLFWCVGYLCYGLLCAITRNTIAAEEVRAAVAPAMPTMPVAQPKETYYADIPAAKTSVRLEHALSIADKLLLKKLGKGDRQELEKIKTTLTVMQVKGNLTPQEGEILNEHFNCLLKLMAKYNL